MATFEFNEEDLPKIVDEGNGYLKIGDWSFDVEDELEAGNWWDSVKVWIVLSRHLESISKPEE
jgi:hypothetical protein